MSRPRQCSAFAYPSSVIFQATIGVPLKARYFGAAMWAPTPVVAANISRRRRTTRSTRPGKTSSATCREGQVSSHGEVPEEEDVPLREPRPLLQAPSRNARPSSNLDFTVVPCTAVRSGLFRSARDLYPPPRVPHFSSLRTAIVVVALAVALALV